MKYEICILLGLNIRFEDAELVASTLAQKHQSLQKLYTELQEEILTKNEALKTATFQIITMKNEKTGPGGTGGYVGVGATEQLKADIMGLREKIAVYEEEKRK